MDELIQQKAFDYSVIDEKDRDFPSFTVSEELEIIRKSNDGILDAEKVVVYASNTKTSLHGRFQWADTIAADAYRLNQARQVIRLDLTIIKHDSDNMMFLPDNSMDSDGVTLRKYVSLSHDRSNNGGYRLLSEVLDNSDMRKQLVRDAKKDMQTFRKKYSALEELSSVMDGMDNSISLCSMDMLSEERIKFAIRKIRSLLCGIFETLGHVRDIRITEPERDSLIMMSDVMAQLGEAIKSRINGDQTINFDSIITRLKNIEIYN